ncbi:nucleotidyltransferase family protein [Pedobacter cryotolerans]|uniref:Nucleotidyltransferase family protein n=1 Tax=Pedobacter cryotolerans TaxID=2571270 RepID=A0A4U1CAQ9_9SPHI|nr:nucleotidyltransferase family protein [Pedobacter cryotolerans]TKC01559.1 nucleotidyltransferase family protein [Pedobacter cryotolerans]
MKTGIMILAAGNSSRLGKPKQLLVFEGNTLLEKTIAAAEQTSFTPVVLVLGAYADEILASIKELNINYIINDSWQDGMSASIKVGLKKMINLEPEIENVIIAVADQPFVTADIFNSLHEQQLKTGKNIIASSYAETIGTPALFNTQYFDELILLEGGSGAKHLMTKHINDVATIQFTLGNIDIDTETDYKNLTEPQ